MKQPAVYMMSNTKNGCIYIGVTSCLIQRVYKHKHKILKGFTGRYNCDKLVFFEMHATMESAILREKQLKAGSRSKKVTLIEGKNPEWKDLYSMCL